MASNPAREWRAKRLIVKVLSVEAKILLES